MTYYYLEGIDKKGPYSRDEMISRNLKSNTMVYCEVRKNWHPLHEFDELHVSNNDNLNQTSKPNFNSSKSVNNRSNLFKNCVIYYIFICVFLTLIITPIAIIAYENNKGNVSRYPYVFRNETNTETMFGNQQSMLFRGVNLKTIYLNSEEQESYFLLFLNLLISNLVSLSFIFIIVYTYMYINNITINVNFKILKKILIILIILISVVLS